jgi:hypothetical protein
VSSFALALLLALLCGADRRALARSPGMPTCPEGSCSINPKRLAEFMFPPFFPFDTQIRIPAQGPLQLNFTVDNTVGTPGGYKMTIEEAPAAPIQNFITSYGVTHDVSGNTGPGEEMVQFTQRIELSIRVTRPPAGTRAQAFQLHSLTTTINGNTDADNILNTFGPDPVPVGPATFRDVMHTSHTIGTCTPYTGTATVFGSLRADRLGPGPIVRTIASAKQIKCDILPGD